LNPQQIPESVTAMQKKQILIVAGEASADRYGAHLVQRLKALHGADSLCFYGTGGDEMQQAGVCLQRHIRDLAHIGVREAISGLHTYYKTYRSLIKDSARRRPDLAVLLDFPDFNLRLAKSMKRLGIKVVYYISPQIWAWRSGRIRLIKEYVDKMLVILPFEENYYRDRGVDAEFVGHPLLEDFRPERNRGSFLGNFGLDPSRKTVAILPGSRRKEIDYILPTLLFASLRLLKDIPAQFLISAAPTVERSHIEEIAAQILPEDLRSRYFRLVPRASRDILANSDFAFVKSGTSSLEAALVGTPFLITYKISTFSWWIGSVLIRTPMKGLVNLIAGEKIVPELYQDEATPQALAPVALEYLTNTEKSDAMRVRLAGIRDRLSIRCASETAAAAVSRYL
jgi:lipid-A-disaccharide synthase